MKVMRFLLGLSSPLFRKGYLCLLFFGLIFFAACGAIEPLPSLEDAEAAGIIMSRAYFDNAQPDDHEIVLVEQQDIKVDVSYTASVVFPIQQDLHFQALAGELSLYAEVGQRVQQGDLLARLTFDKDTRLELDIFTARQRLDQFNADFTTERSRRTAAIAAARESIAALYNDDNDYDYDDENDNGNNNEYTRQQIYLEIRLMETDLERYIFNSSITRTELQHELDILEGLLGGEEIRAPFDGLIIYCARPTAAIHWNPTIITIVDDDVLYFQITMNVGQPPMGLYSNIRHDDIITIATRTIHEVNGVERPLLEFDARVVTDSWAARGNRTQHTFWLVPADFQSFYDDVLLIETDGLPGLHLLQDVALQAQVEVTLALNSPVLPVAAVRFEDRIRDPQNYVFVYSNGILGRRFVETGAQAGGYVQIISGLDVGIQVVIIR